MTLTYEQVTDIRSAALSAKLDIVSTSVLSTVFGEPWQDVLVGLCDAVLIARDAAETAESKATDRLLEIDRWIQECHATGAERDQIAQRLRWMELRVRAVILAEAEPSWWPYVTATLVLDALKLPEQLPRTPLPDTP